MAGEVLVDALPYIDYGYDEPGVKQAALALVEEECRRFKPSKNYLEIFGPINLHQFETDMIRNEFERMEARQPMEMLSMKRYELPPPPPNKLSDTNAWFECVENSYAQLEHQASRIINLEIMQDYGSNAWRIYNQTLKTMFEEAENQLEEISKNIQAINLTRKTEQTLAGERIHYLEHNWVGLVSKNYEIECAISELEKELLELKKRKMSSQLERDLGEQHKDDDEAMPAEEETTTTTTETKEAGGEVEPVAKKLTEECVNASVDSTGDAAVPTVETIVTTTTNNDKHADTEQQDSVDK